MSREIRHINFDSRTFRHSPYTVHETTNIPGIMTYDDAARPERQSNIVHLDETFRAATAKEIRSVPILNISLSGLRADPNIDFSMGKEKTTIRAIEYLTAFFQHLGDLPEEQITALRHDEDAMWEKETAWSIAFFREKLADFLTGPDEFFHILYRGLDNAMGDMQRIMILTAENSSDQEKLRHGSFDLPSSKNTPKDCP